MDSNNSPIFTKSKKPRFLMTKNRLFLLSAFLFSVVLIGCKKNKPTAEFSMSQYEYGAGDALMYENLSTNYDSCVWQLIGPDGKTAATFHENYPNLVTGILSPDGIHKLRLNVYRKKETLTSEKDFLIKSDRIYLQVNAYSGSQGDQDEYDVYVDGQYAGSANNYGAYSKKIPVGRRYVKLIAPTETIEGVYYFDPNEWDVYFEF